ncbi:MAG: hypothetical protein LUQ54_04700 [Methanoregula sp.]|nr:hypothetical protein [Methanoregula sp.]
MTLFVRPETQTSMKWVFVLAMVLSLLLPAVCMASTPPVQPSLFLAISNTSAIRNDTLTFSARWNGYVSYNKPPEQILVNVFFLPGGSPLGTFSIPRLDDICISEDTCLYQTSLDVQDFPSGTFLLIASDQLSGATNRQIISLLLHNKGNIGIFKQYEHEQVFFLASAILGIFMVLVLVVMVREDS